MVRSIRIIPPLAALLLLLQAAPLRAADDTSPEERKNVLVIGRSSLSGLHVLLGALLQHGGTPMNVDEGPFGARSLERMLGGRKAWDYIVMDAWQFTEGRTEGPAFPEAVAAFVKQVRTHSPKCTIVLFPWYLPSERATNEDVMKVFQSCVDAAREHGIWVSTTGPAFTEARLARRDLRITVSKQDAHPGAHGAYINACSLYAIITGRSPVGLPGDLKVHWHGREFSISAEDAKYLQELAWAVYQRELKNTKPEKKAE